MQIPILYEDPSIIVTIKPPGLESQSSRRFSSDMVSEIRKYIHKLSPGSGEPYVGVIHRLDKPVSGVMVYAKTQKAAAALSSQIQRKQIKKEYLTVVCGKPVDKTGVYVDYLYKEPGSNCSRIVDKSHQGSRRAELSYEWIQSCELDGRIVSLMKICLQTGRHHQIRVQLAGHGHPVLGDSKYGMQWKADPIDKRREKPAPIALASFSLSFVHPDSKEQVSFRAGPEGAVWSRFDFTAMI